MKVSAESHKLWRKFLEELADTRKALDCPAGSGREAWFRGHTQGKHQLLPSLFRYFQNPNDDKVWSEVWDMEKNLFWEFSARARELHGHIEEDWDILFAMQHYQTPTRLLDWTEVLGVAVYFATLGVDGAGKNPGKALSPCVWVMNPYKLNQYSGWGDDLVYPPVLGWDKCERVYYTYGELLMEPEIDWEYPVAIYPRQKNARIHAQQAWFTIHGDEFIPLEKLPDHEKFARKVPLPWKAIPAARAFLEEAGINRFTLFGDLTSLSQHLIEKNDLVLPHLRKPKT